MKPEQLKNAKPILFRGKQVNGQGWVYGWYMEFMGKTYILPLEASTSAHTYFFDYMVEVIPETVGWFVGKLDMHKNKIFTGDIVGFEDCISTEGGYYENDCFGEVFWDEETASYQVANRLMAESYEVLDECVVVGNIFDDNPELKGA